MSSASLGLLFIDWLLHLQKFGTILDVEIIFNERGSKVSSAVKKVKPFRCQWVRKEKEKKNLATHTEKHIDWINLFIVSLSVKKNFPVCLEIFFVGFDTVSLLKHSIRVFFIPFWAHRFIKCCIKYFNLLMCTFLYWNLCNVYVVWLNILKCTMHKGVFLSSIQLNRKGMLYTEITFI